MKTLLAVALLLVGCGTEPLFPPGPDGGPLPLPDSGPPPDAGFVVDDAGIRLLPDGGEPREWESTLWWGHAPPSDNWCRAEVFTTYKNILALVAGWQAAGCFYEVNNGSEVAFADCTYTGSSGVIPDYASTPDGNSADCSWNPP